MGRKVGKTPWEHVKPTKYMTREEFKRRKRDSLLLDPKDREIIERGVSANRKMEPHIRSMQSGDTNRKTNGGSYTKKKFGRVAGTTKPSINKRGVNVRVSYNTILKKSVKLACIRFIKDELTKANISDVNKAKRLEDKLVNKVLAAKPNTTLVINPTRIYKEKRQSTITFNDSMFKRNIAAMP